MHAKYKTNREWSNDSHQSLGMLQVCHDTDHHLLWHQHVSKYKKSNPNPMNKPVCLHGWSLLLKPVYSHLCVYTSPAHLAHMFRFMAAVVGDQWPTHSAVGGMRPVDNLQLEDAISWYFFFGMNWIKVMKHRFFWKSLKYLHPKVYELHMKPADIIKWYY